MVNDTELVIVCPSNFFDVVPDLLLTRRVSVRTPGDPFTRRTLTSPIEGWSESSLPHRWESGPPLVLGTGEMEIEVVWCTRALIQYPS